MKRKTISILICLALSSLACLQSAMVAQNGAGETPVATVSVAPTELMDGEDFTLTPTLSLQGEGESPVDLCAQVIASRSLNLRSGPSEHAQILDWLQRGDLVHVTDQSDADWWMITIGDLSGFVKAKYLAERECE